jgi:hypothetical protein
VQPSLALLSLFACQPPPPVPEACVPVAIAGEDRVGDVGVDVALDGSASAVCGDDPVAYGWSLARTPASSALDDSAFTDNGGPTAVDTSFIPDVPGTYAIGLIVTQDGVPSNPDVVVVEVGSSEQAPLADAGADVVGRVGERAILDGSASSDPEGAVLSYRWTMASLPAESQLEPRDLWDAHTASPSFVPDVAGAYVLALTVDDGSATSAPDYASVEAASDDRAPVADAGPSRIVPACESDLFVLDASGSYDPDGDVITYQWGVLAVPDGSATGDADLVAATDVRTTFAPDVDGTYTFWLEVDDGIVPSPKDLVALTTGGANRAPAADAGEDQVIQNVRADCANTPDGPRCEPCPTVRFRLDGTTSTDPDGDALRYRWDVPDALAVSDATVGAIDVWTPTNLVPDSGQTLTTHWDLGLSVADCAEVAEDTVRITIECHGDAP